MKALFFFIFLAATLCSCEQASDSTQEPVSEVVNQSDTANRYQGVFAPTSGISGSGIVKIYVENNLYKLKLENYTVESGPDLKVYLSKSNTPTDFINLGNVLAKTAYSIPQNIDLKVYKFVLIHCQQYNHLFAVAELIQN